MRVSALLFAAFTMPATAAPVRVLYAGSLVNLMEHGVAPAFDAAGSDRFEGYAGGSGALVNQIKGQLRHADLFVSANPALNDRLTGSANGDWVRWYVVFAQSPLVIGYNPASRFAADLKSKPWYEVLQEPGIRIGRTDPAIDPKGALTLELLARAERTTHHPGLAGRVLGTPENPAQVVPEETLVGRLQSGQLDAGFFYSTETADLHIPAITLPRSLAPEAHYSVAILRDAPNPSGALAFTSFLLGPGGRAVMQAHGLDVVPLRAGGDTVAIPTPIRAELDTHG